jgi:diguanylate cyclase (GGDEF)-like protein
MLLAIGALGIVLYAAWIATGENPATGDLASWVYDGSLFAAGLSCLFATRRTNGLRKAWAALGLGLIAWAAGDVYWSQELAYLDEIPYPSWADAGYLLALPCFFVAIGLMIRHRIGRFSLVSWLDGTIAALAAAAAGTAILAPALVGLTEGEPAAVLTNLAYPLGDLILLAFVASALVIGGVRGAGAFLAVAAGLLVWCLGDIFYLYAEATTGWTDGWPDLLWPLGALLIAASAQLPGSLEPHRRDVYRSSLIPPAVSMVVATGILIVDHFDRAHEVSVYLGAATILAALVRMALSFRENDRLVKALHSEAITDALTGLGNRRSLLVDLGGALEGKASNPGQILFALFDLDGFKSYNDNFGHPSGDALLERLGLNLRRAVDGQGTAYRLGGDEFCILIPRADEAPRALVERARAALSEAGEGFTIGASGGSVLLPEDADTPAEALRAADQRMYAEKNENPLRSARQTQDLLMRIMREREPALSLHVDAVTRRSLGLGRKLNLDPEALEVLGRAAELHDIGKIAIPDDILHKKGRLDELEWKLMRRHTLIGERILGSNPAMRPVARLVRASHERWDGDGYPDGLAGERIPIGARIIFVADSFDAMTSDRPYKAGIDEEGAREELRRCAGTQFDPELVELFCELLDAERRERESSGNGSGPGRSGRFGRDGDGDPESAEAQARP